MSRAEESIILVEGYDDRSFWQGLLKRSHCKEARGASAIHRFKAAYTYESPGGALLHVVPCKPESEIRKIAELQLRARAAKPLARLILNPDADERATLEDARASVRRLVSDCCPLAIETTEGDFVVEEGSLTVSAIFWHADKARSADGRFASGIPAQPALEQLACAALCRAYPDRGEAVARWLAGRPEARGKEHKAHAWSFYAGWSTDHGENDFYSSLWRDPPVASALEDLLRAQGAWRIIEDLLGPAGPATPLSAAPSPA